jgi:hypothetical protein
MPSCQCCVSPQSGYINSLLIQHIPADTIIKRVPAVSLDSVKRHRAAKHHEKRAVDALVAAITPEDAAAISASTAIKASTLMDQAQQVLHDAADEFNAARSRGDTASAIKLLTVRLGALRLLGDFHGAFPKGGTTVDARSLTINTLGVETAPRI